ncbi:hypothetical protein [Metaclostridioides mangenotii]|uniref:hypothetical protein n=1 Tax=Metaclostridioides mangenotii TaxID=1540 RepID=UPI0028E32F96|nr:hypothetical protein [Clostridioides mangenotii]
METIKNIIIFSLQPTVVLLVGILTIKFNNKFNKKDISFERLEKVYHPLFTEIEPILYKKDLDASQMLGFIDKFNEISNLYSLFIDFSLKYNIKKLNEFIQKGGTQEDIELFWLLISSHIDKTYDSLSKICNIPIRKLEYRINNSQFDNIYKLYFYLFVFAIRNLLIGAIMLILVAFIFYPINQLLLQVLK